MNGRRVIYTGAEVITAENVLGVVTEALSAHNENAEEEDYLYWYRRGVQPVLEREKKTRSEINNKIVENHAEEIVTFKNGYFLQRPANYRGRTDDDETTERVKKLNEYIYRAGKHDADNSAVDWFHTVGVAPIYIQIQDDEDIPFSVYSLDPRRAFVAYSFAPDGHPVFAVNESVVGDRVIFDVYTRKNVFRLEGSMLPKDAVMSKFPVGMPARVKEVLPNPLGEIPIIEYRYNSTNMGAFEIVLDVLDAINNVQSDRVDGVDQFIQSLIITTNVDFEEDTTAEELRRIGMVNLTSKDGTNASFQILSEELNQTQTQVLVDYLYQQALTICSMPNTMKGHGSTSDNGIAVMLRDGWSQADTSARNTQDLFRKSNAYFDRIALKILNTKVGLGLKATDIELEFAESETSNIQSKAQAYVTLLKGGLHPVLALQKSGVSNNPVEDYLMSEEFIDKALGMGEYAADPAEEGVDDIGGVGSVDAEGVGDSSKKRSGPVRSYYRNGVKVKGYSRA